MTRPTYGALLAALLLVAPSELTGQTWVGWSFHWENDTWVPGSLGSDDAFTNGIRLVLGRDEAEPLKVLGLVDFASIWGPLFPRNDELGALGYDVTSALTLGQNFFTPRSITEFSPDPTDRPYAGFSYAGWRYDATQRLEIEGGVPADKQHQVQHSIELDLGVLGQGAGSRLLQAGIHSVITTHRIPKGWSSQIQNTIGASVLYMARTRWSNGLRGPVQGDITLHGGGMLGTTQTYPFAGATLRLGRGLSGFPGLLGRNTAVASQDRHPLELGVSGGVEGRFMAHNGFVEGALGARGDPGVTAHNWLGDLRVGLFLRILDVRLDYIFVQRSPEVREIGPSLDASDAYGSISVAFDPGPEEFESLDLQDFFAETLPPLFSGFYLEVGWGNEIDTPEADTYRTNVMRGSVGRRLVGDFDVGFEIGGVGREFTPPTTPGADHRDRMTYLYAIALRYRPFGGRVGPFDFHVRGGLGLKGTNETELTPPATGPRTTPCPTGFTLDPPAHALDKSYCNRKETGRGWLAGAGLGWRPVDTALGVHVDLIRADVGAGSAPSFWGWSVGMRWTPGG